ncbi:transcriptional regulator [Nocardia sp. CA-128927]|uniref:ParB/RepB/Spo0J family partition protein n=1 Tax=Nocardia sp. CA-128927 TaxID=3239975 RepID=UPI003D9541DE
MNIIDPRGNSDIPVQTDGRPVEEDSTTTATASIVETVPLSSIRVSGTPRLRGVNLEHIQVLAGIGERLPPIIVNRSSMCVIDGVHRLRAAELRGDSHIAVVFFEGDEIEGFVVAVRANIAHGMPLTLADRKAAAKRILVTHPHWSDSSIAANTALAAKTVAVIRNRSTEEVPRLDTRVGRDGKVRPLDVGRGRERAARLISERPDASLREIAREAGVSPTTVRDVQARLARGDAVVPAPKVPAPKGAVSSAAGSPPGRGEALDKLIRTVQNDPAVRFSDSGKALLRLIGSHPVDEKAWLNIIASVPPHCSASIARIAQRNAFYWARLADELVKRGSAAANYPPG